MGEKTPKSNIGRVEMDVLTFQFKTHFKTRKDILLKLKCKQTHRKDNYRLELRKGRYVEPH